MTATFTEILAKLEPFDYSHCKPEYAKLPVLGPKKCKNGVVYTGQWK